jgi:hypothetical protein
MEFTASNCRTLRWLAIVDGPTAQLMDYLGSQRLLAIANVLTSQLIEVQSFKTANEREYSDSAANGVYEFKFKNT